MPLDTTTTTANHDVDDDCLERERGSTRLLIQSTAVRWHHACLSFISQCSLSLGSFVIVLDHIHIHIWIGFLFSFGFAISFSTLPCRSSPPPTFRTRFFIACSSSSFFSPACTVPSQRHCLTGLFSARLAALLPCALPRPATAAARRLCRCMPSSITTTTTTSTMPETRSASTPTID